MNLAQARVIDPVLTEIVLGYSSPEFTGMELFPRVPVNQRGGKVIEFGKDNFKSVDTARAPGSNTKRLTVGYGNQDYALTDHALDAVVPIELVEEGKVPGIDLQEPALNDVQETIDRNLEIEQADLATTAANYPAAHVTNLTGGNRINDATTDPLPIVEALKSKIRLAIGRVPNKLKISYDVFSALRMNPFVQASVKYTGSGAPTPDKITTSMLAAYFGVDKVVIGESLKADPASSDPANPDLIDIWSKVMILAWVNPQGRSYRTPNFGYTYGLKGYPYVSPTRWVEDIKSWVNGFTDARQAKMTMNKAGALVTNAID